MNISNLLSPETALGKSLRDGAIVFLATGGIAALQFFGTLDLGPYSAIYTAISGTLIAQLNRLLRPIKREQ